MDFGKYIPIKVIFVDSVILLKRGTVMSGEMGTLNKPEPSVSVSQPTSSPFKTEISDLFQARCLFFTDGLLLEEAQTSKLLKELSIFKDIKFSPTDIDAMIFGEAFFTRYCGRKQSSTSSFSYALTMITSYVWKDFCTSYLLDQKTTLAGVCTIVMMRI